MDHRGLTPPESFQIRNIFLVSHFAIFPALNASNLIPPGTNYPIKTVLAGHVPESCSHVGKDQDQVGLILLVLALRALGLWLDEVIIARRRRGRLHIRSLMLHIST
ncbi:hypothetical protein BJX66DRAFT_16744 [Aspergillus keveii]|uniref:Uncharacterized protein n=1 Tax=Aspergillus keveii TaxID=714993 RepID=A0ABR4FVH2_9EURO